MTTNIRTDQEKQGIPRSLGLLLRVLRCHKRLTLKKLAATLKDQPWRFRNHPKGVTVKLIRRAEQTEGLYYYVARLYARWSGFPVGLLYLIAATGAHLRDNQKVRVRRTLQLLHHFINYFDNNMDDLASNKAPSLKKRPNKKSEEMTDEERQKEDLEEIAWLVVSDYVRTISVSGLDEPIAYAGSKQQEADARFVVIVARILSALPAQRALRSEDPDQ